MAVDARGGEPPQSPIPRAVKTPCDNRITARTGCGVVHRAGAGEPPPLRGAARVLRRRAVLRAGRAAVRLHPVGDGEPGARLPGREAGAVRPATQTRSAARDSAGQGPRPRPGDRAAPPRPVHLRDLRAARQREHPAQPHQRGRDPHRGRLRAAAAPPRAEPHSPATRDATPGCRAPHGWTSKPGPPQSKPARPDCCC